MGTAELTGSLMTLFANNPAGELRKELFWSPQCELNCQALNQPRRTAGHRLVSASPSGAARRTGIRLKLYASPCPIDGRSNVRSAVSWSRLPSREAVKLGCAGSQDRKSVV